MWIREMNLECPEVTSTSPIKSCQAPLQKISSDSWRKGGGEAYKKEQSQPPSNQAKNLRGTFEHFCRTLQQKYKNVKANSCLCHLGSHL